ncbi:DUF2490 domain-containing protein [Salinimicrobium sp. TH3]|uniref:DUF2490 domain-containing protein n=1 Tax=Salinimicrobium sp. TH3 TaxID=2997342 RepID=UPI0022731B92|nr:DUF2490 domain-containing protein [Salinimicrobium sp. TH3]MCY2688001.1 DUF2490 domain-containing protein [Salinimicrobium sp. TH3]
MASFSRKKIIILMLFCIMSINKAFSQNSQSYFYDHEFEVSLPVNTGWSMDISAGYRGLLQERLDGQKISGSRNEHLEINHFTNYRERKSLVLSLGLRYRFKELFDSSEVDEFRIIEQVKIDPVNSYLPFSHRFRLEQRFREHLTHRLRYELASSYAMSEAFSLGLSTEALYAVSAHHKPEAEQRFSLGVENSSFKDLELDLSFEYRMENYAVDLAHEFFIMTGVSLSF